MCVSFFFSKIVPFLDNVESHRSAGQPRDDSLAHAHFMLIPKATNTHSVYVILIDLHCNNGCTNVPEF